MLNVSKMAQEKHNYNGILIEIYSVVILDDVEQLSNIFSEIQCQGTSLQQLTFL